MLSTPIPSPLTALVSNPLYLWLGVLLILLSAVRLLLPLRKPKGRDAAGTPPRSISPKPREKDHPNTSRTAAEIAAFGRFPDYAKLSGVPLPKPYPEFDIHKALPRPYRPFRWAYHQTMSFKKLEPDWWLELENTYISRIAQRKALFAQHGSNVLQALPGSEAACTELMEMALQFLVTRYPHYFTLTQSSTNASEILTNKILQKSFSIRDHHPLHVLLENIPEDFAITLPSPTTTGDYVFVAGVICSSLGWNLATKIGKTLSQIHAPVPDYAEKMSKSMDRFFSKLPCNAPIQRGSWGLEHGQPLYMPADDDDAHTHLRGGGVQDPLLKPEDVFLRVDWQTLRRIPLSGAVVFNFKALFTRLDEFRDEPGVPALVLEILEQGKRSLMLYKGTWHVEHVAVPALRAWKEEQLAKGLVQAGCEVATLEAYPWFDGWRGKWTSQQGF
ncbi:hypothetical protein FN846DRAFT_780086 [Sphaerosporella brunnea]|uniref:HRQ family protein n=1 Tax=Sphaerosporella brunnea TaxID=1250544 RepID=A0A5J5ETE5_9PEZI|nr:hypothetical protein FN846DRAFT_780086 [Sphaerosporella brunnea]